MKPFCAFLISFFSLLISPLAESGTSESPNSSENSFFSGRYKSQCAEGPAGCACHASPLPNSEAVARIRHATPVKAQDPSEPPVGLTGFAELSLANGARCFYPARNLRPIFWDNLLCPNPEAEGSVPFPSLSDLLTEGSRPGQKRELGSFFPTFYNIAEESFHEGAPSESLIEAGSNKLIARVTAGYRKELDIQGTGRLRDGRVLNVATRVNGQWNYRVLDAGEYGHGILGHRIHPMRSVAVDFGYLCKAAGFGFCEDSIESIRKKLVGSLLYIPRLEGVRLASGAVHDGYVCAQDIGGAIREDRIDLFVGPSGAGNPYLPDCRTRNAFIDQGIESVNPTDWPTVEATGVDAEGRTTYKRKYPYEYRTASPQKGLNLFLVPGARCKP